MISEIMQRSLKMLHIQNELTTETTFVEVSELIAFETMLSLQKIFVTVTFLSNELTD